MNAGNEKVEPKIDLQLGMNYFNQRILKNDSGAGANAVAKVDMMFVASSPLSELVWSPDKGLSFKCADSSFDDKTTLFWDVRPSNFVIAMPQSVIGVTSTIDKPIDDVFTKPIAAVCIKSNISGTDTPPKQTTNDSGVKSECKKYEEQDTGSKGNMDEMSTAERNICNQANAGTAQISGAKEEKVSTISGRVEKTQFDNLLPQASEPEPIMEQNPLPRDQTSRGRDIGVGNQAFETDDVLHAKAYPLIKYKGSSALGTKLTPSTRRPFEKLESTAENDLQTLNCKAACGVTSRSLVSKSNEIVNKSQDDKNLPIWHSPSNSKIHMFRNEGQEKALSDGDINVRFSLKEDKSHDIIESCNSAGLFSTSKKGLNFQQQLMVGSKRVKRQIPENSVSKPLVKQDSSFMNWISNMMKGFPQSIQEATNCLAHTFAYPDHAHQWPDQKLIIFNRNQNPEPKKTGFQFIFESMYCPSSKHLKEGSKSFDLGNKVHGIDATSITSYADNDILYKQCLQSDEVEGSRWRYEAGPSFHPKNQPVNFANSHESSKNNPVENKNCSNLGHSKEREGMTSSSSSARQKTNNTEYIDSSALSERKEADNSCHRSDTMGSLWITRFFPRLPAPLKISDHLNQDGGTQVYSSDCSRLPHSHKHVAYSNKCKIEEKHREQSADEARELENYSINKEASNGTMDDKVNDHSMHKFNPMWPSPRFSNSEPMASMFVRRLDAIKYIIPSNETGKASKENMNCLFCRTKGHQLCDCAEIAGTELPDLLKKVNSHVGLEELPCFCIKCFQHNHWAISCPTSISRGKHELEFNALVNDCSPSRIQSSAGNREIPKLPTDEEDNQLISGCSMTDKIDLQAKKNLSLNWKLNEVMTSEKIWSNALIRKHFGSNSEENNLKEKSVKPPSCFVERKISHVPEKIFEAVKKLRLSRTDILKWINSHMSISHLDGFYLRLRLGKWEEDLGGTGYYVASINEANRQSSQQNTRKSLSVNVGGIKCMVESRYISNQDFLEEEIMAWWCTSGNIPSEEDLIEKIKKKRMLDF